MKILAVDLGSHLGVAYREEWGICTVQVNLPAGGGRHGERCHAARLEFLSTCRGFQPEAVGYELSKAERGLNAVRVHYGLEAILLSVCEELRIPYRSFTVLDVKHALTGKKTAEKHLVKAAAEELLGRVLGSDDEADAVGVLLCAEALPESAWGGQAAKWGLEDAAAEAQVRPTPERLERLKGAADRYSLFALGEREKVAA